MSTIVTRAGKGSPLTNTEVDSNFTNLNTDKLEINAALGTPASVTLTNATGLPTAGLVDNAVTDAKLRDSAGLSVIGRGANSTGDPADIVAGTNHQVLRRDGSSLGFGAVDLSSNQAVTGTLPVNQGGTGITSFGAGVATWLGTPSSANLAAAVTNETGSGALVFATSPALVTPALGTPSSASLINAINLPIVAGTTGTLSVARGGTGITSFGSGVATFLGTPSSANLAAAVTDETGTGALVFATSPTLTGAIIDGTTIPARTNPLAQAVSVQMTAAASGSSGIRAIDDSDLDMGTNDFTLHWEGSLPDYTPEARVRLLLKRLSSVGYQLSLETDGALRITLNAATFDSTVAIGLVGGSNAKITTVIVRESAAADGSITFYVNGVQLGAAVSIPAATPATISNANAYAINGFDVGARYASILNQALLFNRALTAAEVLDLSINGPALADRGASQTPVYTTDFSAGVDSWTALSGVTGAGNIDSIGGKDNNLRLTTDGTANGRAVRTFSLLGAKNTRVVLELYRPSANVTCTQVDVRVTVGSSSTGTLSLGDYPLTADAWTLVTVDIPAAFVTNSATAIGLYFADASGLLSNNTSGDILYLASDGTFNKIGLTSEFIASNAQSDTGQIFDTSGNKNHALLPASGATVVGRPVSQTREVRWTNTWDGTNELQYIGGVNQAILPANAYIESIIGTVSGATPHDIIIGDGSDTNRYVTITTGLAAGTTNFALAARTTDGTNLKLTVDPDTDATMSIAWVIRYSTLEA